MIQSSFAKVCHHFSTISGYAIYNYNTISDPSQERKAGDCLWFLALVPAEGLEPPILSASGLKPDVYDVYEELHCETCSIYRLRTRAIEKLLHLRYGAGAGK